MSAESWTSKLAAQEALLNDPRIKAFLEYIAPLQLEEKDIVGNVAIIGPGQFFPERCLLCFPQGDLVTPRDEIDKVVLTDTAPVNPPRLDLSVYEPDPIATQIQPPNKSYTFLLGDARDTIERFPYGFFNAILAFQILNLGYQRKKNQMLFPTILSRLSSHGIFTGSGGFSETDMRNLQAQPDIIKVVQLPDPGFYGENQHIGFIFKKRV